MGGILLLILLLLPLDGHAARVGDAAPDFQVTTLKGRDVSYYRDIKGKRPVYLVFWATW
jgi:peroxiredoxin